VKDDEGNFPQLNQYNMPTYSRAEGDKRLMCLDASSGRHNVLTNCLNCGKVVTEEEGWGPCLFCGNPLEIGDRFGIKRGDDRGRIAPAGEPTAEEERYNESFERANATKDRLLSYDRDAKKRTKVVDDATDWYSEAINPWLSEKQREDATRQATDEERRKKEEKRKIHVKIDLFGRTVFSAEDEVQAQENAKNKENFNNWTEKVVDENKLMNLIAAENRGTGGRSQLSQDSQQLYDKLRASLHATNKSSSSFQPQSEKEPRKATRWDATDPERVASGEFAGVSCQDFSKGAARLLPVEESPYGDSSDPGQCLSMHQPWASLLVCGFKRAEGRTWPTQHRGRLWIHAAGKEPEQEDVELLEAKYRSIYEAQGVPLPLFPSQSSGYPTSVLLGCVDLEECFTNEDYKEVLRNNPSMPQEESDSEHIFWCLRPRRLTVPLRMGGDHKIWRLPKLSLSAAQRGLYAVRWPAPSEGECIMSSPILEGAEERHTQARKAVVSDDGGGAESSIAAPSAPAASSSSSAPPAAKAAASRGSQSPPALDLWPKEQPAERLEVAQKDRDDADRDAVVLQNGFVHLVGFVPPDVQQRLVDMMRDTGVSEQGFFAEQFDGVKVSSGVTRLYLGMHWNPVSQTWERVRSNIGGAPVAELPKMLSDMYDEAVKRANRQMGMGPNKKRKLTPFPEGKAPTMGVANFFTTTATMQLHQDKQESKASIDAGYAVMGICLGDACEFAYGAEAPATGKKPKAVRLESGDVYLFGGESRMMWHGVIKVIPRTAPPNLRLIPGRLSLTMRVL